MIIMITRARVYGCFGSTGVAALVLLVFGTRAGALAGGVVGGMGAPLSPSVRLVLATIGALAVLVAALLGNPPWQPDRETPRAWLRYGDWRTAATNGVVLGLGFPTRLGFWLWYLVPLAAFASGSPSTGALIFLCYSAARLLASLLHSAAALHMGGRAPRLPSYTSTSSTVAPLVFPALAFFIVGTMTQIVTPVS